jgi:uncharacterized membrane protein
MSALLLGLVLFIGVHSLRMVSDDWRSAFVARRGLRVWKGLYALVSFAGLLLIVWGYGLARQQPVVLWSPPVWTRHLAAPLMLVAMVLLAAAYVPRNALKARLHHPMVLGVKVWALAHLLANGTLADVWLFGSFLVWAVLLFRSARRRDRDHGTPYAPGTARGTAIALGAGLLLWALFVFRAHAWLIGVQPLG